MSDTAFWLFIIIGLMILLILIIILIIALMTGGTSALQKPTGFQLSVDASGLIHLSWQPPNNALIGEKITYHATVNVNNTPTTYQNLTAPNVILMYNGAQLKVSTISYPVTANVIAMSSKRKSPFGHFMGKTPTTPIAFNM
jgi:hypothetical protein